MEIKEGKGRDEEMFKLKKGIGKFILSVLITSMFLSTTAFAISQTEVGGKFLTVLTSFLDGVRENKMKEKKPAVDSKVVDIKGDIQTDLDQAKLDAKAEVEQYIDERTAQHLLNLEKIRESLKLNILSQKDEAVDQQKALIDAELKAQEEQLLIDLNLNLE